MWVFEDSSGEFGIFYFGNFGFYLLECEEIKFLVVF